MIRLDSIRAVLPSGLAYAVAGAVIVVLCGMVIAGWHATSAPADLPLGLEPLQYDTAWAFAFIGAALIAFGLRLGSIARVFAAVPIALGTLRIVAYAIPGFIPIRPLLALPWLPFGAGNYNEMAMLTAIIVVSLGGALVTLRPAERGPMRSVIASLIATVALALALLLLFGAWTGGAAATRWLMLTGGDRTNALLAIVIAAVILGDALLGSAEERLAIRRFAPVIVWFAVFVCVLVLWRALAINEVESIQDSTRLVSLAIRNDLERDLDNRIAALQRLGNVTRASEPTPASWTENAHLAIQDVDRFEPVGWIDNRYILQVMAPAGASDLLGVDVRADPVQGPAALRAIASRAITFTPVIDLGSGRHYFVIFVPVWDGNAARGLVAGKVIDGIWFESRVRNRFADYEVALFDQETLVEGVPGESPSAGDAWTIVQRLRLADARANGDGLSIEDPQWTIRVTPTLEYLKLRDSWLPDASLALGALLATLLALCTYLFLVAQTRAQELGKANTRLVADIDARERAEHAQRESEERTRLIIAGIRDHAIYMLDADGRIVTWNAGATQLTGYADGEVLGRDFSLLYPPDGDGDPDDALTDAVRDGWSEKECWHLRKDGRRFRGDDMISAMRNPKGELQGFSVITRDATQRIQLREQTERSRDFYFSLFSDIPNMVWRCDAGGACDYVNKAWLDYTGRRQDDELIDGWSDGLHPDDRAAWDTAFHTALRERKPFEIEFRLRRQNGDYGSLICSGHPYHDMQGGFRGFLFSCYDNTERRQMDSALKESEQRYEAMTSNVPGMVFQLTRGPDGKRRFVYLSRDCETLTGLSEATLREDAEAFLALIPGADRPHLEATLEASATQLSTWTWSGRLNPAHEATEKWVTIRARAREAQNGDIVWDGVVLDDTANRLIQLEVERSREEQRSLSRHLQSVREEEKASIAREMHDELGASLTALKMDLDHLQSKPTDDAAAIRERIAGLTQLVDGAVATTRRIVTDLRPSMLDDLGLAAAIHWQAGEYAKRTRMKIDVELPDPDVDIDRERALTLFRIFQETLTNVMRHAQATEVDVRLSETDDSFVLQIHDNGIGISEEALRKPTSHGIRGMRERAREHGGDVSVSGAPGEGTTLVVTIPKARAG